MRGWVYGTVLIGLLTVALLALMYYGDSVMLFIRNTNQNVLNASALSERLNIKVYGPMLDRSWVNQFFDNVSEERGMRYTLCPSLSDFAELRFKTMMSGENYWVSHYGNREDSAIFLGGAYYYYTGEEVLYPRGYTPKDYAQNLRSTAQFHWQGMMDNSYSYYGYYLSSGPTVSVYDPCSVREITGPDVDARQLYGQHGCRISISDDVWLVLELSTNCVPI